MPFPEEHKSQANSTQERQLILQNSFVSLWYYPKFKIVHHQMLQAPSSEIFRELLTEGASLVERHRVPKWLSDDRGNTLLRPDDEEWSAKEWMPRVLRGGFKYWAVVLPEAAIGQLNMRRLAAHHKQHGIISCVESSPLRALDWLKAQ